MSYEDQGTAYDPDGATWENAGRYKGAPRPAARVIQIGTATVTYYRDGAYTTYPDGTTWAAQPHETADYYEIANRCGYGGDILAYCREHEIAHHLIGEALYADGRSPVLWALAHRQPVDDRDAALEEAAVMMLQRWVRAGERPIIGGVDWDGLKTRALALLDA